MTAVVDSTGTLDRVMKPASIAVLGASGREGALSGRFISGLQRHGYRGRIAPVNPRYEEIAGLACFPTVGAAAEHEQIDLAIVSLPRDDVLDGLEQCHAAGVAGAVIFASGFGETGPEGRAEQQRLTEFSQRTGLRLIGPNSPGFINVAHSTCVIASGVGFRERFRVGGIGLAAQSGGVAGLIIERAQDAGAGFSAAVCTGNEADLTVGELLPWFAADEQTRVVAVFLEGVRQPERLLVGFEALRAAGKPLVVLKAGATEAAARATAAHTGALASSDDVVNAVFERYGIARVYSFDDLIDTAVALDGLGPARGRRLGIISTSGGAGVVATEAAERAGLELPELSSTTRDRLAAVAPDFASLHNPADMSGMFVNDPEIFRESLSAFADAEEVDASVLVLTVHPPDLSEQLADRLLEQSKNTGRSPAVLWTAGAMSAPARARLREAGLAVFEDADRCMRALAARALVGPARAPTPVTTAAPPQISLQSQRPLLEDEILGALEQAGLSSVRSVRCPDAAAAASVAQEWRAPVVVKAAARGLLHKTDAGAIVIGVEGADTVAAAHESVVAAAGAAGFPAGGSIVQELVPEGFELIVGIRRDPDFGPILVVGPGGLAAELVTDLSRRLLPLHSGEAIEMLRELAIFPLLDGYRGRPRRDVDAAAAAIEALGAFATALGDRLEAVEVNPLIVHDQGVTAVDALLLLTED